MVAVVGGVLTTWQPAVDHLDDHRLALLHAGPNLVGGPAMEPAIALIQTVRSHAIPLGHPRQRPDERARVRVGVEEVLGVEHLRTEVGRRQIQAKRLERHAERRRPTVGSLVLGAVELGAVRHADAHIGAQILGIRARQITDRGRTCSTNGVAIDPALRRRHRASIAWQPHVHPRALDLERPENFHERGRRNIEHA